MQNLLQWGLRFHIATNSQVMPMLLVHRTHCEQLGPRGLPSFALLEVGLSLWISSLWEGV